MVGGARASANFLRGKQSVESRAPSTMLANARMVPLPRFTGEEDHSLNNFSALPWAMRSRSAAETGICSRKARASFID